MRESKKNLFYTTRETRAGHEHLNWLEREVLVLIKGGGLAQLARALDLHSRGHRFDSDILHR